jgi:protein ImuB
LLHAGALLFPCRRLIEELAGFLQGREAGVQRLDWHLQHPDGAAPTRFALGAARPERDPACWLELLRERLERLRLPAPVRAVRLEAGALSHLAPGSLALFPGLETRPTPDTTLLDRLRARLGREAVYALTPAADHRPERAWRQCPPGDPEGARGRADRPLWLLPEPLPLETRDHRPWWDGQLDLGVERERIETGWWDGFEVARDYFIATSVRGERLWVYREMRGQRRWFLHGIF